MTIDIARYSNGQLINGALPPAPQFPQSGGQKNLAVNTNSATYLGPCVLALVSTTKVRVDVRNLADAGSLDPDNSPSILAAEVTAFISLPKGSFILKANTWS